MAPPPVYDTAVGDEAIADSGGGPKFGGRPLGALGVDYVFGVIHVEPFVAVQQVHVGAPVGLDRSHVAPVAGEAVAVYAFGLDQARHDVAPEVGSAVAMTDVVLKGAEQDLAVEHVDAHRDDIALGTWRLLVEGDDRVVLVEGHNAESAGVLYGDGGVADGDVGLFGLMERDHLVVVH